MVIGKILPKLDNLKTVPKNMNSVFATFRLSLFDSSQFLIFSKSSFTLKCNSDVDGKLFWLLKLSQTQKIFLSPRRESNPQPVWGSEIFSGFAKA